MSSTSIELIDGAAGPVEVAIDQPDRPAFATPRGFALVLHPNPVQGGANENKVVQTIARACVSLGFVVARPNFRGVGASAGTHDEGRGELDDMLAVFDALRPRWPGELVLAGFSFGSYVQSHVAARLAERGTPVSRVILVGTATSRWTVAPVPADALIVHGELDDVVPLGSVLDWARPQELPVVVMPGADHFFHRKLIGLKRLVLDVLAPRADAAARL